ncbi:ATP-binding protein [Mangrovivirga sp. M17]|uniref:histidine kinase n=1 Tax=Mangrovivirga halotolerans TaxID=2993936 RepID=A0ABT3RST4_9BACT|nr:ATP-binding protein [Mangrovivirga halotolerans]MCX2744414.1 ATP-binding protein [Mangrovivirga halotolerans]
MNNKLILIILFITASLHSIRAQGDTTLVINEINYPVYKSLASGYLHTDPDSAFILGQILVDYLDEVGDNEEKIVIKGYMAISATETGDFKNAVLLTHQSLALLDDVEDQVAKHIAYTNAGLVYKSLGYYTKAIEYYQKALDFIETDKKSSRSLALGHIGDCLINLGEIEKGLHYIQEAHKINIEYERLETELFSASYLMNANLKLGYNNEVLDLYQKYKVRVDTSGETLARVYVKLAAAKAYMNTGGMDSAFILLRSIEREAEEMNLYNYTEDIYKLLADFFESKGLRDRSDEYYKKYVELLTVNSRTKREREIQALQMGFDLANQAEENQRLLELAELKDAAARRQTIYTWIFLGLSVVLAFILYRSQKIRAELRVTNQQLINSRELIIDQNQKIEQQNRELEEKVQKRTRALTGANNELRTQNDQLEQYAFITAHNLRSPIARMIGLIQILNGQDKSEQEKILGHIRGEAKSLDQIVQDLNQILSIRKGAGKAYEEINIKNFILDLIEPFKKEFNDIGGELVVNIPNGIKWNLIPAYFKSIIQNLINNSLKYRDSHRKIRVEINVGIEGGELIVNIIDNAIGMDMEVVKSKIFGLYQRFTTNVEGKGMGLYMVKLQAEAMNGRIEVKSEKGLGSEFTLRFQHNS